MGSINDYSKVFVLSKIDIDGGAFELQILGVFGSRKLALNALIENVINNLDVIINNRPFLKKFVRKFEQDNPEYNLSTIWKAINNHKLNEDQLSIALKDDLLMQSFRLNLREYLKNNGGKSKAVRVYNMDEPDDYYTQYTIDLSKAMGLQQ